jgi:uncharacterized protein (TIRG00374 family)
VTAPRPRRAIVEAVTAGSTAAPGSAAPARKRRSAIVKRVIALVVAAVGLYFVWPAVVDVFGSVDQLKTIRPGWFAVMAVLELASFACTWMLIGLSTATKDWVLVATAELVGNAVSSIVPGGAAAGGPLQFSYMVRAGEDPGATASGLTAVSLLTTTTLFGLAALSVPATLHAGNIDARLEHAAWLGLGAFVVLFALGAIAMSFDKPLHVVGRGAQWVLNHVRRKREPVADLDARLVDERNRVRRALGRRWVWALVAVIARWAFDYFALVAAIAASGVHVQTVPVLLAYIAASVLAMIPITPGGLGFVEAGLATTLVWAGVPAANATLATLAYRLVSYWLPLVLGIVAALVYRARYGDPDGTESGDKPVQAVQPAQGVVGP